MTSFLDSEGNVGIVTDNPTSSQPSPGTLIPIKRSKQLFSKSSKTISRSFFGVVPKIVRADDFSQGMNFMEDVFIPQFLIFLIAIIFRFRVKLKFS